MVKTCTESNTGMLIFPTRFESNTGMLVFLMCMLRHTRHRHCCVMSCLCFQNAGMLSKSHSGVALCKFYALLQHSKIYPNNRHFSLECVDCVASRNIGEKGTCARTASRDTKVWMETKLGQLDKIGSSDQRCLGWSADHRWSGWKPSGSNRWPVDQCNFIWLGWWGRPISL